MAWHAQVITLTTKRKALEKLIEATLLVQYAKQLCRSCRGRQSGNVTNTSRGAL
jgi:hypothetical protein